LPSSEDDVGVYLLLLNLEDDNSCGDAIGVQSTNMYFEVEIINAVN